MSLLKELNSVIGLYKSEVNQIKTFVEDIEKSIDRKTSKKSKKVVSDDDKKQLANFIEVFIGVTDTKTPENRTFNVSNHVSGLIGQLFTEFKHKKFLYNMALSYLISHQEAFIKDYIYQILTHRKNMLKSKAIISYEELLKFPSIKIINS